MLPKLHQNTKVPKCTSNSCSIIVQYGIEQVVCDLGACLVNDGEGVLGPGAAVPDVRQPHTLPHNSHHIQPQVIFFYL
jgi:hypothetical protein